MTTNQLASEQNLRKDLSDLRAHLTALDEALSVEIAEKISNELFFPYGHYGPEVLAVDKYIKLRRRWIDKHSEAQ